MAKRLQQLLLAGITSLALTTTLFAQSATDPVESRIKPVGAHYIEGEVSATAAAAAEPAGPRSGSDVYQSACFACHGTGALNAPKKGDAAAWSPRVAQGMETLLSHALNGFNAMPPRGTCGNCSDDEIKAAIEFMLEGI